MNGVFWIVQVPDDAVQINGDSLTITLHNVAVVDQLQFPGGTGTQPVTLSFTATYVKSGEPRVVKPKSHDPLSPFTWAGTMWAATNSGNFSLAYNNGSFSAVGTFSSSGMFGEMGTERNGSFARDQEAIAAAGTPSKQQEQVEMAQWSPSEALPNSPRLKGRIPLKGFTLGTSPVGNH
jgi:hypothetical protein